MEKKLRISHIIIQPVLFWDDGEELTAGPPLEPLTMTLAKAIAALQTMPADLLNLEKEAHAREGVEATQRDAAEASALEPTTAPGR